jgi:hypothetical protein
MPVMVTLLVTVIGIGIAYARLQAADQLTEARIRQIETTTQARIEAIERRLTEECVDARRFRVEVLQRLGQLERKQDVLIDRLKDK